MPFLPLKRHALASQGLFGGENCFLGLSVHTSAVMKTAFNVPPYTQTDMNGLRWTSEVLKFLSTPFLAPIEGCTSFTGHPLWSKLLSRFFLALKMPFHSFTRPSDIVKTAFQFSVDTQIGVNKVHGTSTELKTVFCIFPHTCLFNASKGKKKKHFNCYSGSAKLMHACLCVRRHNESSFHQYGGAVKLVQASLGVGKDVDFWILTVA